MKSIERTKSYFEEKGYKLYSYQVESLKWMIKREKGLKIKNAKLMRLINSIKGGLLCDEPGLGKTIQMISLMMTRTVKKTLIIVPKCVVNQWYTKIIELFGDSSNVCIHKTNKDLNYKKPSINIVITSFGLLFRGKPFRISKLSEILWDRLIIDEIHFLRNPKSKINIACNSIKARYKWGLTGTPINNSINDIFSLYSFLGFKKQFLKKLKKLYRKNIKKGVTSPLKLINKYIIKKRTKEVLNADNLPELEIIDYQLNQTNEERKIYEKISKINFKTKLEKILRLRQANTSPDLCIDKISIKCKVHLNYLTENSSKINKILSILEKKKNEKVIIFVDYKSEIELLSSLLSNQGYTYEIYEGLTSTKKRESIVNMFSGEKEKMINRCFGKYVASKILEFYKIPNILIMQKRAGAVGLNLCNISNGIIVNGDWNPYSEEQAICRIWRLGSRYKKVYIHRLFNKDTIDDRVLEIQRMKKELIHSL